MDHLRGGQGDALGGADGWSLDRTCRGHRYVLERWPGRGMGVRAPMAGETPLSADEVRIGMHARVLGNRGNGEGGQS